MGLCLNCIFRGANCRRLSVRFANGCRISRCGIICYCSQLINLSIFPPSPAWQFVCFSRFYLRMLSLARAREAGTHLLACTEACTHASVTHAPSTRGLPVYVRPLIVRSRSGKGSCRMPNRCADETVHAGRPITARLLVTHGQSYKTSPAALSPISRLATHAHRWHTHKFFHPSFIRPFSVSY